MQGLDIMDSTECAVSGRKAYSISPLVSKLAMKSLKNLILAFLSWMTSLPMLPKSNWMFFLAASERPIAWSTSFTHSSTVSRSKAVMLERAVKFKGTVGI